ncbi:MAG: DUF488 domain-containing protein [Gammaproteobacteria bacterium]|nr:DUF488 domain-containing protein [Gammaproteobacteria bacterium]
MLFSRQKLILSLLHAFSDRLGNTDFQKLLFLYTREMEERPSYDFVPYSYGCFSFTSYADKRRLTERGFLMDCDEQWEITKTGIKSISSDASTIKKVADFHGAYKNLSGKRLIVEVYRRYPYYASRSKILEKVLPDRADQLVVQEARPGRKQPGLLTIGYEGKSLELYLNQLLQASVTLLCDVRRNPLSRKYGFSKSTLKAACERLGIRYEHLPELGIASDRRRNLIEQSDYKALFGDYMRHDLPRQADAIERIKHWIESGKQRVALTCFELQPHQCHRHCVAEVLANDGGRRLVPVHL